MIQDQGKKRGRPPKKEKLSDQVENSVKSEKKEKPIFQPPEGNFKKMTHTGSTLFDLALTGGKIHGGGLPSGVTIELYGEPSLGKTALLLSIGGQVEKAGGDTQYQEPEARLSTGFAEIIGYNIDEKKVLRPDTPDEMFSNLAKWKPKNPDVINACLVDSLAALISKLEKEGTKDEYARVAKDFNRGLRVHTRMIEKNNYLFICSNQIRDVIGASFGETTRPAGGWGFKFFGSLRIRLVKGSPYKLIKTVTYRGNEYKRPVGNCVKAVVEKSSVWKPYREAPIYIIYDKGIDDVRANLQYVKDVMNHTVYYVGNTKLSKSIDESIAMVEENGMEEKLRQQVIELWEEIESLFNTKSKKKKEKNESINS